MLFKNIKGQDSAINLLKNSIANNRISHAYIFFGPAGVGKRLVALAFAKALNCATGLPEGCGECISCKKIDNRNHPDVFLSELEKGTSSIKIDKIREIIKDIGLKPYEGRKKVYIIDNSDAMTPEASNALLKTLEEPASESILILITERLKSLLPTVISRAQVVKFYPLAKEALKMILANEYGMDAKSAHVLASLASGRLGEALKYKDGAFLEKRTRVIDGLIRKTLFDSDLDGLSRADLKLYLDVMLTWYRDIMVAKTGIGADAALVNIDKDQAVLNEAARMRFDQVDSAIKEIVLTNSFLDQNANPKLAMAVLGVKLMDNIR